MTLHLFYLRVRQNLLYMTYTVCPEQVLYPRICWSHLTINLTAVGRSAHTFFKGLLFKKSISAKNQQKIPIPRKMSAESKSRVKYPSKTVNLCLFYASEQAKVQKRSHNVYTISHSLHIFAHIQVGGGGGGKAAKQDISPFMAKIRPFICRLSASQTSEHFVP